MRAPVYKIHGEDYEYLFEQIRVNGYRRARIDGKPRDLGDHIELDEDEDAHGRSRDRFVRRRPRHRPASRHVAGARPEARRRAARLSHREAEAARPGPQEVLRRLRLRAASARRRRDAGVPVHVQRSRRAPARPAPASARRCACIRRCSCPIRQRTLERGGVRQRRAGQQPRQLGRPDALQSRRPLRLQPRHAFQGSGRGARAGPASTARRASSSKSSCRRRRSMGQQHAGKKIKFNGVVQSTRALLSAVSQAGHVERRHGRVPEEGDGRVRLPRMRRRPAEARPPARHDRRPQSVRGRRDAPGRAARISARRSSRRPGNAPSPRRSCAKWPRGWSC